MNIFKIKLSVATAYLLIGAYFHRFFRAHYIPVLILFGITAIWSVYLWLNKMKNARQA